MEREECVLKRDECPKYKSIMKKKKSLYKLRSDTKAKIRELRRLRDEIDELTKDYAERLNLPKDKGPREFVTFLRKYRGLNNFMAYKDQKREPLRHEEYYDFNCEIVSKWTIKDVNECIKTMQQVMKLTKEEAIAKIIVDTAHESMILYQHLMNIPNGFAKFVDEKKRPVSVPQGNVRR